MDPKITVVVPVYNTQDFLAECLDSICNQTLDNIEILCVNDGTTDDSLYLLREFEDSHTNIKVINQFNAGVGAARNTGILNASGEFIAFMDSDDYYLEKDTLEKLYRIAKKSDVSICGGSFAEDHEGILKREWSGIHSKFTFKENKLMHYCDYQFDYGYYRFIYNRKMLLDNNIFYPHYKRFQDPPFFVKAMITAGSFYAVKDVTYCYRCGHQKFSWDEQRAAHLLSGLIDNLKISKDNNLYELNRLTTWRLLSEFRKIFVENIASITILNLLDKAKTYIDIDYVNQSENLHQGFVELLMEN